MVESRQEEVLSIIAVFTVFSFVFVAFRVYSRYLGRNFGWDDYLIIGAMVILFGQTIAIWKYIQRSGTGFHVWDLPKRPIHEQVITNQWNFAVQMFYHRNKLIVPSLAALMGAIRASIIVFLWRMKDNRRRIRYSLHAVFWLNIIYTISTSLGNILQCRPVRYAWARPALDTLDANGKVIPGGQCFDSRTFILTSCALSIFMDLIIIPIPSIMVWNLQMDRKTKILVVVVMSLGWVATGVSVGRFIVYYYRFAPTMKDRTWDIGIAISIAEPAVHIMTACAPATKGLFRYLFPYFARSSGGRNTSTFYEDRQSATSRKPRPFSFGLANDKEGVEEEIGMANQPSRDGSGKGGVGYKMKRLSTVDSRDELVGEDGKSSMVEAEPQHCLGQAK